MTPRRSDSGAMAILLAASMVFLFGLAALAVDAGFMYTRRAGLQSAADAAALAGARGGLSTTRAAMMATANGYTQGVGGVTVATTSDVPNNRMTVQITTPQPLFFASGLGYAARTITARAIAQAVPITPAVLALGSVCPPAANAGGVEGSSPALTINGDVAANAGINLYASTDINGNAVYGPCASVLSGGATANSFGAGSAPADPYASLGLGSFTCGNATNFLNVSTRNVALTSLSTGVFCSGADLDVNFTSGIAVTATFVAVGRITFSGTTATITAASNGLVAFSTSNAACPATQAINTGSDTITFNGSFYAPNGCLNFSGNTMTINGSLIGSRVQLQAGNTSVINGPGGSSPGSSYLYE